MSTAKNGTQPLRQKEKARDKDDSLESGLADEQVTLDTPANIQTIQQQEAGNAQPEGEPQSNESRDAESIISDREDDVRLDLLDEIKKNWEIQYLVDMIADGTWLKGVPNPTWQLETLEDFQQLSGMTKNKARSVKVELEFMWKTRNHNHYYYTRAVGIDWETKEPRIREDLQTFLKQLGGETRPGVRDRLGVTTIENGMLPREADLDAALKKLKVKRTKVRRTQSTGAKRTTRSNKGDSGTSHDIDKVDDVDDDSESRAVSPDWSDGEPADDDHNLLKKKIKRYWSLKSVHCTDAIPEGLRPKEHKNDGAWSGAIYGWGLPDQKVLKQVCKLACITRGRHEDVVKKLTDLVNANVKVQPTGVGLEEIAEAYKCFGKIEKDAGSHNENDDDDGNVGGDNMNGANEGEAGIYSANGAAKQGQQARQQTPRQGTQTVVRQLTPTQKKNLDRAGRELEKAIAILREKEQLVNVAKDERDIVHGDMDSTPEQRASAQKPISDMEMEVRTTNTKIGKLSNNRRKIAQGEQPSDDEADNE